MSLRLLASWIWLLAAAVPAGAAPAGWLLPLRDAWLMALLHVIAASTLVPWCSPRGADGRRPFLVDMRRAPCIPAAHRGGPLVGKANIGRRRPISIDIPSYS